MEFSLLKRNRDFEKYPNLKDVADTIDNAIQSAVPIWQVLKMTEEEYNEKYNRPIESKCSPTLTSKKSEEITEST